MSFIYTIYYYVYTSYIVKYVSCSVCHTNFYVTTMIFEYEKRYIFSEAMEVVENKKGEVLFLYGYGGTDKTFMWNTLAITIRSKRKIVLPIASSGITILLLPGGRTSHYRFKISVPTLESSICNINKKNKLYKLLNLTDLIICDETLMDNKFFFEAFDKSLKYIMSENTPASKKLFGGKVVVFGVDFR